MVRILLATDQARPGYCLHLVVDCFITWGVANDAEQSSTSKHPYIRPYDWKTVSDEATEDGRVQDTLFSFPQTLPDLLIASFYLQVAIDRSNETFMQIKIHVELAWESLSSEVYHYKQIQIGLKIKNESCSKILKGFSMLKCKI